MTTTNQALLFYVVLLVIFYYASYKFSVKDKYINATIGACIALLLSAILYKYNYKSFTQ